jgi:hypothetical protein
MPGWRLGVNVYKCNVYRDPTVNIILPGVVQQFIFQGASKTPPESQPAGTQNRLEIEKLNPEMKSFKTRGREHNGDATASPGLPRTKHQLRRTKHQLRRTNTNSVERTPTPSDETARKRGRGPGAQPFEAATSCPRLRCQGPRRRRESSSPFPRHRNCTPPLPHPRPHTASRARRSSSRFGDARPPNPAMAMQGARSRLSSLLSRRLLTNNAGPASSVSSRRSLSSDSDEEKIITATLFPGDGIGPEIAVSVKQVSEHSTQEFWVFRFWVFHLIFQEGVI